MSVSEIIALLGGTSAVARYTNWPTSTVDSWIKFNQIPEWRQPKLLEMAAVENKALSTADFPPKSQRAA